MDSRSSYKILIIGSSGSGKANALVNLMYHEPDIGIIYLRKGRPRSF